MKVTEPNFKQSIDFLRLLYPKGPWTLTEISINKQHIDSATFSPGQLNEVLAWLNNANDKERNIYYSVNQLTKNAISQKKPKASKEDIASVHYLHVDVDPRAGENVATEQTRILAELQAYPIKPSFIVFSGGGYNALWALASPIPIADGATTDDEITRAIDVERRNWQFELDFKTEDHCRDVSRVLRLPGTLNRPDQKKIDKGRSISLAKIHDVTGDSYPYEGFPATPFVPKKTKSSTAIDIQVTEDIDELKIPDQLKVIIVQGDDPDDSSRFKGDRSLALWYVCCELVRHRISDDVILGIIVDRRYGISASVLDKTKPKEYGARQVERARDQAENPTLGELNDTFAVILNHGGKAMVMIDNGENEEPEFQTFTAFKDRIRNYEPVQVGEKKMISAFDWWTSHRSRREYKRITFAPGLTKIDEYNLWRGFSYHPTEGDGHKRYLDHMFNNICDGNQDNYDYLLKWMARVVQQPRTCSMVAPILLGEQGTGKSIFANFFGNIFDPHRCTVSDPRGLTGRFNTHISSCLFVLAEETIGTRNKQHEAALKEFITGEELSVEAKGHDRIIMPNYTHLMMTSNYDHVIAAEKHERRFFVLRVSSAQRQNLDYFEPLMKDQKTGGVGDLLNHLMLVDLSEFKVMRAPRTQELRNQQEGSLSLELEWLLEKLEAGAWFSGVPWTGPIIKTRLYEDYLAFCEKIRTREQILTHRKFVIFVKAAFPQTGDKQVSSQDRAWAFIFPTLNECRKAFDDSQGWTTDWPKANLVSIKPEESPFE